MELPPDVVRGRLTCVCTIATEAQLDALFKFLLVTCSYMCGMISVHFFVHKL